MKTKFYAALGRGLGEWRWINVLYECDWMDVCMLLNMKNKQKEWHRATKPSSFMLSF
jgi:hypothetical protein